MIFTAFHYFMKVVFHQLIIERMRSYKVVVIPQFRVLVGIEL